MNGHDGTGDGMSLERRNGSQVTLAYGSVSGERWAPGIETAGSRSTGEAQRRFQGGETPKVPVSSGRVPRKVIQSRRQYLQSCLDELDRADISGDDPIAKSNCLTHVKDHLDMLWDSLEGDSASEALEEMINVLQVAFCDQSAEAITPTQMVALKSVVGKLRDDSDINDQVANELTEELIRGGVDVFREIG